MTTSHNCYNMNHQVRVKYFRESGWKEEGRETHIWELGKVSNQTNYQRRVSQDGFQMGRFGL
jgi:hypothetical protein